MVGVQSDPGWWVLPALCTVLQEATTAGCSGQQALHQVGEGE